MVLQQPFPTYSGEIGSLRFCAWSGFCVFLILWLLKPFGFDELGPGMALLHAFLFGLVTFVFSSANALLLPWVLPAWFKEENWTVGREILMLSWQLCCVALGNYLLSSVLYSDMVSVVGFLSMLAMTLTVGIFPVTLVTLLKLQLLLKKYSSGAARLEETLHAKPVSTSEIPAPDTVTFYGDNQDEELQLEAAAILYIEAAGNYIRIHTTQTRDKSPLLLRSTLRKATETLADQQAFFRCHRTYLVNLEKVAHVQGNAQGYKLDLIGNNAQVPVSRNLNNELSDRLRQLHRDTALTI